MRKAYLTTYHCFNYVLLPLIMLVLQMQPAFTSVDYCVGVLRVGNGREQGWKWLSAHESPGLVSYK